LLFPKYISRTVLLLSLVSLLNDASSEMLYPILPLFLASMGTAPALMGIIEGVAEIIAALMKWLSGTWSDEAQQRKPFVLLGYGSSGISKGLLALATGWFGVFIARALDRFGKGLRSPARDALLADNCNAETRGAVFGFHRSADTLGAVIGPLIAILCLAYALSYQQIFLVALIPAVLGFICLLILKENKTKQKDATFTFRLSNPFAYWQNANTDYKKLLIVFGFFALFNSSDMFLILRLQQCGVSTQHCIYYYLLFNIIFSISAFPIGVLSDKLSKPLLLVIGFLLFAITYSLMAFGNNYYYFIIAFITYGLYNACTDGISKAMIVNSCSPLHKGKALGTFSMVQSLLFLGAGIITGLLWQIDGGKTAFTIIASASIISSLLIVVLLKKNKMIEPISPSKL
jgi:MFS family permease